jgi:predicted ATPase
LVETQPELLAEHFREAGMIEKAIGYCLKAGLRSRDRFAHAEAINHLAKGLKLLEALEASAERDARELELLGPLGTARSLHVGMQRLKSVRYSIAPARCANGWAKGRNSSQ